MKKRVFHPAAAKLSGRTREMTDLALRDFLRCGIAGWCLAVSYTHLDLKAHFRPEFLNRLDEMILFKPLTKDNISRCLLYTSIIT